MSFNIGPLILGVTSILFLLLLVYAIYTAYQYNMFRDRLRLQGGYPILLLYYLNNSWITVAAAIISFIIAYIIVSMAIPKGRNWYTFLHNDYTILIIGILIWLLGPAQLALYYKGYTPYMKYVLYVIFFWFWVGVLFSIIISSVQPKHDDISGKTLPYMFIQGLGFSSLVIFCMVLFMISPFIDGYKQIANARIANILRRPQNNIADDPTDSFS